MTLENSRLGNPECLIFFSRGANPNLVSLIYICSKKIDTSEMHCSNEVINREKKNATTYFGLNAKNKNIYEMKI